MTNCAELADYAWLIGPQAGAVLRDLAEESEPLHAAAARLRRQFSAGRTHLLLEQVDLRGRATAKFERADEMFFTRVGLEQATDQWVAAYKARRFAGRGPIADLCCGIGGDLIALADEAKVVGVDRDPVATCLATANAGGRAAVETSEVAHVDAGVFASWHIDPDRRPAGNRTSSLAWSDPNGDAIERLLAANPDAAIKLAPGADVPEDWCARCELEWISRDRQCRQLVAWHGELAQSPGERRATVLAADGRVARAVSGRPNQPMPLASQVDRFVCEPDPAVLAADLTGAVAAEHNLRAISAGVAYLTGATAVTDPALACFEVEEIHPLDLRQLARHLRARNVGRLEVKVRGVEHEPEKVRERLRLAGNQVATLLLTKLNRKRVAIVARRVQHGDAPTSPTSDPRPLTSPHAACL